MAFCQKTLKGADFPYRTGDCLFIFLDIE